MRSGGKILFRENIGIILKKCIVFEKRIKRLNCLKLRNFMLPQFLEFTRSISRVIIVITKILN